MERLRPAGNPLVSLYSRLPAEVNDKGDNKDDCSVDDGNESTSISAIDNSRRDGRDIV